ncbi:tRNA (pseudouridine(54)-N(1))-methyltransferase TrmY [Thermococcus piezophilus]|uniref:tRNA (pseudouridine(54)-N(1))-methyltransferase n=1 Tax=Thermococcus piezophilus TaxID=1712654 RepID=A0A172WJE2_9EURY|nr:tRNA (pseudouridine(54)-N(1))-methyltransferase TrmY [Thermococcus piezophilus]ANF23469.1 tRNA (pseudouridine(54)-N(1))-methyltransferase TrmY [Thermococcus piezophilus]
MRTFIVKANKAHTKADFKLRDLPGTSGRIDLLCRVLNSAFLLSYSFRKNVRVWLSLYGPPNPPKAIRFEGQEMKPKTLNPDELSTAKLIIKALKVGETLREPSKEVQVLPGIYVSNMTFEDIVRRTLKSSTLYYLHEEGRPIGRVNFSQNVAFILGDHEGLTPEDETFLEGIAEKVSIGRKSYLASHVVAYVNIFLDSLTPPP